MADNLGFVNKFEKHIEKNGDTTTILLKDLCLGCQVVWQLAESYKGNWHKLFFDNYFLSVPLVELQRLLHIFACATIRPGVLKLGSHPFGGTKGVKCYNGAV